MAGTLNGALEVRGILLDNESLRVSAEGYNEIEGRLVVLRRIHVRYELDIPAGSREKVERALSTHAEKCSMARTLRGAVEVTWSADIREAAAGA